MKIVDAYWEKRNIGLNTLELEFEDEDTFDTKKMNLEDYDYIVAKVPAAKVELMLELQNSDFKFIEVQYELFRDNRKLLEKPSHLKKISDKISYHKINTLEALNALKDRIDEGLFDTDRISLDPYLGYKLATNRYINWIDDEFKKGTDSYELQFTNSNIGFFLIKQIEVDAYDVILGGLYSKYKGTGLGFSIVEKPIDIASQNNIHYIKTRVSSNNHQILQIYLSYGYRIDDIRYIFRKLKL